MADKVMIGEKEYSIDSFSENAKAQFSSALFSARKIKELKNMQALLQRAKKQLFRQLKERSFSRKDRLFHRGRLRG
jgi:hypothetical protein